MTYIGRDRVIAVPAKATAAETGGGNPAFDGFSPDDFLLRDGSNSGAGAGGFLNDANEIKSVDWHSRKLLGEFGGQSLDWLNRSLVFTNTVKMNWTSDFFNDSLNTKSFEWSNRKLFDAVGQESVNYNERVLIEPFTGFKNLDWQNGLLGQGLQSPNSATVNWFAGQLLYGGGVTGTSLDWRSGLIYYGPEHGNNATAIDYNQISGSRSVRVFRSPLSFFGAGALAVDFGDSILYDNSGTTPSINWRPRFLIDSSNVTSVSWDGRILTAEDNIGSLDWKGQYINFRRSETTAPPTAAAAALPQTIFGDDTALLGNPATWMQVKVNNINYKIPCYALVAS